MVVVGWRWWWQQRIIVSGNLRLCAAVRGLSVRGTVNGARARARTHGRLSRTRVNTIWPDDQRAVVSVCVFLCDCMAVCVRRVRACKHCHTHTHSHIRIQCTHKYTHFGINVNANSYKCFMPPRKRENINFVLRKIFLERRRRRHVCRICRFLW